MLFTVSSTRASRNVKGILKKEKWTEADEEQENEHKDETEETFTLFIKGTNKNVLLNVCMWNTEYGVYGSLVSQMLNIHNIWRRWGDTEEDIS